MKEYFILQKDHTPNDVELKEIEDNTKLKEMSFGGKKIKLDAPVKAELKQSKGNFPDFLIGATSLLIISEKLKCLLPDWTDTKHIQFLPIEFKNNKSQKYYVLNILDNIKCLDWDESECEDFPDFLKEESPHLKDKPKKIRKLKLIESEIAGRNIFRMYEQSTAEFISSDLKNKFEENKITGCSYAQLSEYNEIFHPY